MSIFESSCYLHTTTILWCLFFCFFFRVISLGKKIVSKYFQRVLFSQLVKRFKSLVSGLYCQTLNKNNRNRI